MTKELSKALHKAHEFMKTQGEVKQHGDITVTMTMFEREPVKLTYTLCEHLTKRKKFGLTVEK